MCDKRQRKGGKPFNRSQDEEKATKDEKQVAKWMRSNVQIKCTKLLDYKVEYFKANKAVEALLNSKFAKGKNALFQTRKDVVKFLQKMLEHKFFHRAKKIPVGDPNWQVAAPNPGKNKKNGSKGMEKSGADQQKAKQKVALEMHFVQIFVDQPEPYVWLYQPTSFTGWLYGLLALMFIASLCTIPLWPESLREIILTLSEITLGIFLVLLGLVILRALLFGVVFLLTGFRYDFWIFPNLFENLGVRESLKPFFEFTRIEDEPDPEANLEGSSSESDEEYYEFKPTAEEGRTQSKEETNSPSGRNENIFEKNQKQKKVLYYRKKAGGKQSRASLNLVESPYKSQEQDKPDRRSSLRGKPSKTMWDSQTLLEEEEALERIQDKENMNKTMRKDSKNSEAELSAVSTQSGGKSSKKHQKNLRKRKNTKKFSPSTQEEQGFPSPNTYSMADDLTFDDTENFGSTLKSSPAKEKNSGNLKEQEIKNHDVEVFWESLEKHFAEDFDNIQNLGDGDFCTGVPQSKDKSA